ncbi:FAR1-related protein [Striga asiatica]|uniref:FAR1-related protein n=1 Tax=Striga asiatica TaxID=4170 RepID=A0A5A7P2J4_STRAF|nr:FAR1-related protein [Striga asiatica]
MTVSWKKDEQLWRVLKFNEKHNHPLTSPSKVHALRVHRDVSPAIRSLAVKFRNANLRTSDLRRVLQSDAGVFPFSGSELKDKTYRVTQNVSTNFLSCSCQKFNDMGIPGMHMLYMMQVMQIKLLPEEYILSRWTQEVGSPISFQTVASPIIQARGYIERSRGLSEKWKWLIQKAALTEKSTIMLHKMFEEAE